MKRYSFLLLFFLVSSGCQKDWLEAKSDNSLVIPSTIQDFQALLDYESVMNQSIMTSDGNGLPAELAETGSDNYYLNNADWAAISGNWVYGKSAYVFDEEIFSGMTNVSFWNLPYQRIFYANNALDGIGNIYPTSGEQAAWNNVKGSALFIRAYNYWWLAQVFCKPYDASTATEDLGLPLRLTADLNEKSVRSSIAETYNRIITDLKAAIQLLPDTGTTVTRPSKAAAYAMLSRTYMSMRNYPAMLLYADSALQLKSTLLDFNTLVSSASYPIPRYNIEVTYNDVNNDAAVLKSIANVDTTLIGSYNNNDLRKQCYFKLSSGTWKFVGGYYASRSIFAGPTIDELYLMRSEGYARAGNVASALYDLNIILEKRFLKTTYMPYGNMTPGNALYLILKERRKELCFRGIRWVDIRRLNQEDYNISVKRILDGKEYVLNPNSPRFVYPLPDDIIAFTGMQQNQR